MTSDSYSTETSSSISLCVYVLISRVRFFYLKSREEGLYFCDFQQFILNNHNMYQVLNIHNLNLDQHSSIIYGGPNAHIEVRKGAPESGKALLWPDFGAGWAVRRGIRKIASGERKVRDNLMKHRSLHRSHVKEHNSLAKLRSDVRSSRKRFAPGGFEPGEDNTPDIGRYQPPTKKFKKAFACPYYKNNPQFYADCNEWHDRDIRHVKDHIKGQHPESYPSNTGHGLDLESAETWQDIYKFLFPQRIPSKFWEGEGRL